MSRYSSSSRKNFIKRKTRRLSSSVSARFSRNHTKPWQWYEPAPNSAPIHFLLDTSLHGLRYVGMRKRHLCERLFWFGAFTVAIVSASVLIWKMWDGYVTTPIITVFNPTKKTLNKIPFPSVTLCSMNNVKMSVWKHYLSVTTGNNSKKHSNETLLRRYANIMDVLHICDTAKTFGEKFFTHNKSTDAWRTGVDKRRAEFVHLQDTSATLADATHTCDEMIIFCLWLDVLTNCNELFYQVETDYGFCCVYNMLPVSLMRTHVKNNRDDPQRVKDWKEANLNPENLILENANDKRKYPYRQFYAGRSGGLSFLVDPHLHDYLCTSTDSAGFVVGVNSPLDFPQMKDKGSAVRTGTEVFMSVRPEITLSDESTRDFDFEKRHCYFDGEKKLAYYKRYSASNCMDECIANTTLKACGCQRYYMPTDGELKKPCPPEKYRCTEEVKEKIIESGLDGDCALCWPVCTEILYHTQATSLRLREGQIQELLSYYPNSTINRTRANSVSIIHIFFSVDSVFPRLRKKMKSTLDLISDAGGLLGLCMGFSMLSLLEIIYHATIRLFCKRYRDKNYNNFASGNDGNLQHCVQPGYRS